MRRSNANRTAMQTPQAARTGAVLVEAAIVLPIFLLLLLGIIEFGRAMMVQQVVTTAARDACRTATLDGSSNSAVEAGVEQLLADAVGASASEVTVVFTIVGAPGSGTNGTEVATAEKDDMVTVEVQVPYNAVSFGVATYLADATLRGRMTMRHE